MLYTKQVSFSEAEPVYPSFLTGLELMKFYIQTKGGTKEQLQDIASALGMTNSISKQTGTYSSGMLKKLSLLLSFAGSPKLVLLDEPFITLDVAAVQALRQIIDEKRNRQVSFLISSHQEFELDFPFEILSIQQQTIIKETNAATA